MPTPRSHDQLLNAAQVAIDSALSNAEVQAFLTPFGYPPEELQQGRTLYEAALDAFQKQRETYAHQFGASATLDQLREDLNKTYMQQVKLARIAFKEDTIATTKLGLTGERKRNFSGWLGQVQQFYSALSSDQRLQQGLARFGVTPEAIDAAQAGIEAVMQANVARETQKGEAQQSTKDRDVALNALLKWHSDFIAVARIALAEKPQLLETLGILVAS